MKLTFKSEHEYGTTIEMTFDTAQLDEIEDMFKLFLKGSGFHFEDEEEEPQRPVKSYSGGKPWYATPTSCSLHPDAPHGYDRDRSLNEHRNVCKCESWEPPMYTKQENIYTSEKCVHESDISATADKTEISATEDKEEPVAYKYADKHNPLVFYFTMHKDSSPNPDAIETALYTAPTKREWVGLTDEEIKNILDCGRGGLVDIKKAEQILKEKNGG
jgi:hypothetical protein